MSFADSKQRNDFVENRMVALVENEIGTEGPPGPFEPRSIADRAEELQGSMSVKTLEKRNNALIIEIPL